MLVTLLVSLAIVNLVSCQCPNPETVKNFDVQRYLGKWFEVERSPFFIEDSLKCITAQYSLNADGTVKVNNTGRNIDTNEYTTSIGEARIPNQQDASKLKVAFVKISFLKKLTEANYWVLDTDYDSYALIYSCSSFFGKKFETSWILSRSVVLEDETKNRLKEILDRNGIDSNRVTLTDQTNC